MRRKRLVEKFLVILTVFMISFLDWGPILRNMSLAAEEQMDYVDVKGYFSRENIKNTNALVCDVNDETIKLNFEVSVKGDGYFKSGVLKFDNELNFKLNPDDDTVIKNNQLKLPEVNNSAVLNVSIPISFEEKNDFNAQYLSKNNKVVFKGEYIDSEGFLNVIEKEFDFNLSWKESTESKIDYEIIKNLDFEKDGAKGKILQALVKVSGNYKNKIPLKSSQVVVDIPICDGLEFAEATVNVNKLLYTQGREDYNISVEETNYNVENGKVIIDIENSGDVVNKSIGEDSYILTFIYNGEIALNSEDISSKIVGKITNYGGNEESIECEMKVNLGESIGETVQYFRENKETPISKGYLMANSNQEKYEIDYVEKDILNISRADLVSGLEIVDVDEYFIDEEGKNAFTAEECSYYKRTEFVKDNLVKILGEQGFVEILNMNDEVIGKVTLDIDSDENGALVVNYETAIPAIKIRFSDPIADGNIEIVNTKYIKSLNYSKAEIKNFSKLISHNQGFAIYNEGITTDLGIVETSIDISKISSGATIEVEEPEFSTTVKNENVNFKIRLNNNEDVSDLYENPIFEVRLPEVIREVSIRNIDMFYANGELEIANVENFVDGANQVIRISLSGAQSSYDMNEGTNGTVISFDLDLVLDELSVNGFGNVEMYYHNGCATGYDNEVEWLMALPNDSGIELKNGSSKFQISYKAPTGLINAQGTETIEEVDLKEKNEESQEVQDNEVEENNETSNRVVSAKQGEQSDLIEEGVAAKLATMYISILNNTSRNYSEFKILGRIPFIGNTDVITGEDLGTTVDTILDTEISCMSDIGYTVYYSENPYATDNLNDFNNGWETNFYKMGAIKSYLIVLDENYVLEADQKLEFKYDYVIPADLKKEDKFYGTYATYFKENSTQISSNNSADKVGYTTGQNTEIEGKVKLVSERVKELSTVEYEVYLKNLTNVDARNLEVRLEKPVNLIYTGISNDVFEVNNSSNKVSMKIDKFEANSEMTFNVKFDVTKYDEAPENVSVAMVVFADNVEETDLGKTDEVSLEKTNIIIDDTMNVDVPRVVGAKYEEDYLTVESVSNEQYTNIKIVKKLDSHLKFVNSNIVGDFNVKENYDENTNTIVWEIDKLDYRDKIYIGYNYKILSNDNKISENKAKVSTEISFNNGEEIIKREQEISYFQPEFKIVNSNMTEIGYSKAGQKLNFEYEIENYTNTDLYNVTFVPTIDSGDAYITTEKLQVNDNITEVTTNNTEGIMSSTVPANTNCILTIEVCVRDEAIDTVSTGLEVKYDGVYSIKSNSYTNVENQYSDYREINGFVFEDENKNRAMDESENVLSGVIVELYDSVNNKLVDTTISDVAGRYEFKVGNTGNYFVKFKYDDEKYLLNSEKQNSLLKLKIPLMKIGSTCVTDNLVVNNGSFSNINLPLTRDVFDMKVNTTVEKMILKNSAENTEFESHGSKLAKIDIDPELVSGSEVLIEYKIEVVNQGNVAGEVSELVDYMPKGMEFDSNLNPEWYKDIDGNLYTRSLSKQQIKPGESKILSLILIRNMTDTNTGLVHNSVEIASAFNEKGMSDIDSTPNNKLDEDDLSYADAIIGVSTGNKEMVVPMIIVSVIVLIPLVYGIWKIIDKRRYV